jgi:isocitrate dehydrogenase
VIVRENEEDLYAGIEHRQTDEVYQCLKLISRPGCERLVRYAFAYARAHGRTRVTCMTKDNIMKMTDGLFHRVFDEVAAEYPELAVEHMLIDIGAARLADEPERFDVIVTPNLYGDILSDIAAQLAGSVGLAGSANIGEQVAMFEAIHGSAPDIAGEDIANPSGLLQAAILMLIHIGQPDVALRVYDAWAATLEDRVLTVDLVDLRGAAVAPVGTRAFARAVIERLGRAPQRLRRPRFTGRPPTVAEYRRGRPAEKRLVGVDVFVHAREVAPAALAACLQRRAGHAFQLSMITNRGVKVWPDGLPETCCTDHWRCRFMAAGPVDYAQVLALLAELNAQHIDIIKTENLCTFDGQPGYTLGQGQ